MVSGLTKPLRCYDQDGQGDDQELYGIQNSNKRTGQWRAKSRTGTSGHNISQRFGTSAVSPSCLSLIAVCVQASHQDMLTFA